MSSLNKNSQHLELARTILQKLQSKPGKLIPTEELIKSMGERGEKLTVNGVSTLMRRHFSGALSVDKEGIKLSDDYTLDEFSEEIGFQGGLKEAFGQNQKSKKER